MGIEQFEIDLGNKLHDLRKAKGKTQLEVSKELGLNSRETVKQWELGERHIKAKDLIKLSEYYGVSVDYLIGRRVQMEADKRKQALVMLEVAQHKYNMARRLLEEAEEDKRQAQILLEDAEGTKA